MTETGTSRRSKHPLPILRRYEVDASGCWIWLGYVDIKGYARCKPTGRNNVLAHRVLYEHYVGPIPDGLDLDHLCRVPSCVNPDHMEPVTRAENVRRGNSAKLTLKEARELRVIVDRLCSEYGVRPRTLAAIGERKIWKDV